MSNVEDLKAIFRTGAEALQQGRFAEAAAIADRVLAISPNDYDASHLSLMAALHSGRGASALPTAERLVRDNPNDVFSHNALGAVRGG